MKDLSQILSVLIIATGLSTPNVPEKLRNKTEGYEDFGKNENYEAYEGKSVLILGEYFGACLC